MFSCSARPSGCSAAVAGTASRPRSLRVEARLGEQARQLGSPGARAPAVIRMRPQGLAARVGPGAPQARPGEQQVRAASQAQLARARSRAGEAPVRSLVQVDPERPLVQLARAARRSKGVHPVLMFRPPATRARTRCAQRYPTVARVTGMLCAPYERRRSTNASAVVSCAIRPRPGCHPTARAYRAPHTATRFSRAPSAHRSSAPSMRIPDRSSSYARQSAI